MSTISGTAIITRVRLQEQGSSPSTPSSGFGFLYAKSDGKLFFKNDAGVEYDLTGSTSGVTSLNGESGAVTIVGGTNISVTVLSGNAIQISATGGAGGVSSLNGLTGSVTLVAGSNVIITQLSGNAVQIAASGGGGSGDTVQSVSSSTTFDIDVSDGNVVDLDLVSNITTLTFSNVPAAPTVTTLSIYAKQDGTGGRTITWPASVKWSGGIAPVLTTTASRSDVIVLTTFDGGTTWFGFVGGYDFNA